MTSWSSRIKICFYELVESIIKKKMSWCETECKKNVPLVKQNVIDKELIRRERKDGREGEERGLRKEVESSLASPTLFLLLFVGGEGKVVWCL